MHKSIQKYSFKSCKFKGKLQISYCESQPALYYLFFPDEGITKVVTGM